MEKLSFRGHLPDEWITARGFGPRSLQGSGKDKDREKVLGSDLETKYGRFPTGSSPLEVLLA